MKPHKITPLKSDIIQPSLKTLSELRKYIERPRVVDVRVQKMGLKLGGKIGAIK